MEKGGAQPPGWGSTPSCQGGRVRGSRLKGREWHRARAPTVALGLLMGISRTAAGRLGREAHAQQVVVAVGQVHGHGPLSAVTRVLRGTLQVWGELALSGDRAGDREHGFTQHFSVDSHGFVFYWDVIHIP